jgi:hypothetical protein
LGYACKQLVWTKWNEFNGIIVNGKELTDLEIKIINKTFEEWVEVFTHQKININLKIEKK